MTKKKLTGLLLSILMVLPMLASLVVGIKDAYALPAPLRDTQNIVLHKRIFRDKDYIEEFDGTPKFQNDGEFIVTGASNQNFLELSDGLNGATFVLVDVSTYFNELLKNHSREEAEAKLQAIDRKDYAGEIGDEIKNSSGEVVGKIADKKVTGHISAEDIGITSGEDGDGLLLFENVSKYNLANQHDAATYMIVETDIAEYGLNVDLTRWTTKMLVSFPIYNDDDTEFSNEYLHLYPKNLGYARDPWFVKLAQNLDGSHEPLKDAQFALYRVNEGVKEYVYIADPTQMPNMHDWKEVAQDELGHAIYTEVISSGRSVYTSDENGVVSMDSAILVPGTYYFEEIASPSNYLMTEASRAVKVEIPDTWDDPVLVNGQAMREPEPDWTEEKIDYNDLTSESWSDIPYVVNDEIPHFTKELVSEKDNFSHGEVIEYEITTPLPTFPDSYTAIDLIDTPAKGLEIVKDSFAVLIDGTTLEKSVVDQLMTFEYVPEGGFTAHLNMDFLKSNVADLTGRTLALRFKMTITKDAIIDTGLVNESEMKYTHDGTVYEEKDEADPVYTGGRRFIKVDVADEKALVGAEFKVKNATGEYLSMVDGAIEWTKDSGKAELFVSDSEGKILVEGLAYGKYQLEETKAPTGYQLLSTPVSFEVSLGSYQVDNTPAAALKVGNMKEPEKPVTPEPPKPGGKLPQTGEASMNTFLFLGLFLIIIATGLYSYNNLKRAKK